MYRTDLWTQWDKGRVGQINRVAWKYACCYMENRELVGTCYYDTGSSNPVFCDFFKRRFRVEGGK